MYEPMTVDESIIGATTGTQKIVVERGPVSNFANAILEDNPVYHDLNAAKSAGFDNVPAPAVFGFAMAFWGAQRDLQPAGGASGNPGMQYLYKLRQEKGGTILHGEQAFEYRRPLVVGDVLVGEGKVVEAYEKESGDSVMTFVITQNEYRDEKTGELVLTSRTNLLHRGKK